jgi:hypothetical protein
MVKSNYFSPNALRGLNRMGDLFLPRNGEWPSFSEYGCADNVDDLLAYAPPDDIATLNTVLGVLSYLPEGILRWIASLLENSPDNHGPLGDLLRLLNLGLRSIIYALYYANKAGPGYQGPQPHDVMGYQVVRVED